MTSIEKETSRSSLLKNEIVRIALCLFSFNWITFLRGFLKVCLGAGAGSKLVIIMTTAYDRRTVLCYHALPWPTHVLCTFQYILWLFDFCKLPIQS